MPPVNHPQPGRREQRQRHDQPQHSLPSAEGQRPISQQARADDRLFPNLSERLAGRLADHRDESRACARSSAARACGAASSPRAQAVRARTAESESPSACTSAAVADGDPIQPSASAALPRAVASGLASICWSGVTAGSPITSRAPRAACRRVVICASARAASSACVASWLPIRPARRRRRWPSPGHPQQHRAQGLHRRFGAHHAQRRGSTVLHLGHGALKRQQQVARRPRIGDAAQRLACSLVTAGLGSATAAMSALASCVAGQPQDASRAGA